MTVETDFQEAVRHPQRRQEFLHSLNLGDFYKCVRTLRYSPNGPLRPELLQLRRCPFTPMRTDNMRAIYLPTPRGIKYTISVFPAAFDIDGHFGNFLSNLDHELYHCEDTSNNPEKFKVSFFGLLRQLRAGFKTTDLIRVIAEAELRIIEYQKLRFDERGVTDRYSKAIEDYRNLWETLLRKYHDERGHGQNDN